MNIFEAEYTLLLKRVLLSGDVCENRTNEKCFKLFNQTLNIDLQKGFPILTGKKIFFEKALAEFNWIFEGRTDLKYLNERNIKWWDDFAINGKLGKVYGYQVRNFCGIFDQVEYCIEEIKNNSRRAIITLWNPTELKEQVLPCCYTSLNFVRSNGNLNMAMDFRSSDLFLGLPYDIIVGALFLIKLAEQTNLEPHILGLNLKDAHVYKCHKKEVLKYIKSKHFELPHYDGQKLNNYKSGKFIKTKLVL